MNRTAANIVVLDRDGVINHDSAEYIKSASEWEPIEGSIQAIAALSAAGFRVFIATNQSGLARGLFSEDSLAAMHGKMSDLVTAAGGSIERVFFCPHHPDEHCRCRKPAAGLLDQLEEHLGHSVAGAWLVGDSLKDLLLAISKQCRPVLVLTGNGADTSKDLSLPDIKVVSNLATASEFIIAQQTIING